MLTAARACISCSSLAHVIYSTFHAENAKRTVGTPAVARRDQDASDAAGSHAHHRRRYGQRQRVWLAERKAVYGIEIVLPSQHPGAVASGLARPALSPQHTFAGGADVSNANTKANAYRRPRRCALRMRSVDLRVLTDSDSSFSTSRLSSRIITVPESRVSYNHRPTHLALLAVARGEHVDGLAARRLFEVGAG